MPRSRHPRSSPPTSNRHATHTTATARLETRNIYKIAAHSAEDARPPDACPCERAQWRAIFRPAMYLISACIPVDGCLVPQPRHDRAHRNPRAVSAGDAATAACTVSSRGRPPLLPPLTSAACQAVLLIEYEILAHVLFSPRSGRWPPWLHVCLPPEPPVERDGVSDLTDQLALMRREIAEMQQRQVRRAYPKGGGD